MNARMLPRFISLLGKLIVRYDVLSDATQYSAEELDLLRLAKTEYDFYHTPAPSDHVVEKSNAPKVGERKTLGLKTTR